MRRVPWIRADAALWLALLLTLPAVNTRIHAADEIENFVYLRSVLFDGDIDFTNEYRYFYDAGYTRDPLFVQTFMEGPTATTVTGLRPNYAPVGSSLLWAPWYLLTHVGVLAARGLGADVAADGLSPPYLAAISIASAVYGALAIALSVAVARRFTSAARLAGLVVLFGTPLIFYMYAMPGMSHAPSAFAVAWFVWWWLRVRTSWTLGGVATLAALGALMGMVREQEAFLVLVPAMDYLLTRARTGELVWRDVALRAAVGAAAFLAAFLPQWLAYKTLYDRFGPSPVIGNKMQWHAPFADNVVFSPAHGWVFWTPLVVLAIAGLIMAAARVDAARPDVRRVAALLLGAIAIQIYVVGSLQSWTLQGAFGQRRFVGLTVCLVAGVALLWDRLRAPAVRRVVAAIAMAAIWWNLGLALRFGEGSMNRQRLELARDLRGTFIELPLRLPSLAYRYLFDRSSFYQPRAAESRQ